MAASERSDPTVRAAYEHSTAVRLCHWLAALSLVVLTASGLEIFRAFPSFGDKIPERVLLAVPDAVTLGGWLGGALKWHLTFMWIFAATGAAYALFQIASGGFRQVLFGRRDLRAAWPMLRYYLGRGPEPDCRGVYNPLQKLAYTGTIGLGALTVVTGAVLYKPVQLASLAHLMGGFGWTRAWHFAAMCGFLAFIPVHLVMVALHGWANFASMLIGWKITSTPEREPEAPSPSREPPTAAPVEPAAIEG